MIYRIYPPIGIARLGNSSEFFIAPEEPGSPGKELRPDASEVPVTEYKTGDTGDPQTSFQVKRQAARFRVYEFDDAGGVGRAAVLPAGAAYIEWTVTLKNKKDAAVRPNDPPPSPPDRVSIAPGRANRMIDAGTKTIGAPGSGRTKMVGKYLDTHDVELGQILTDPANNLLVMGGPGISATYENASIGSSFYNNPGWHDDVADGPVTARFCRPDGTPLDVKISPAWIVTAPPDFAPAVQGPVTLYDRILAAAIKANLVKVPSEAVILS